MLPIFWWLPINLHEEIKAYPNSEVHSNHNYPDLHSSHKETE